MNLAKRFCCIVLLAVGFYKYHILYIPISDRQYLSVMRIFLFEVAVV